MLLQALCIISWPLVNSNWSYSPETPNLGKIRRFLGPCDLEIWRMTLKNNRPPLLCYFKLCASFRSHWWNKTGVTVRKRPIWDEIRRFLELCDLEIWGMTLKNNRAPLLCYLKLCASFGTHWRIQTGVTVRKRLIWVEFDDLQNRVTLKFDVWPRKTIGHLFYATSSSVHHFVAIGEFKLGLQSGNAQFGSNSWFSELCDLEIWHMTSKNNRAPLLCYFKLCASFHSYWWIQTWVTVRKCPIWVKFDDFFLGMWPWNLTDDLEKQ